MSVTPDKFFTAMSHSLRLRALVLLQKEGELCVCELTHALSVVQPMISRHLAQLRELEVVSDRREGLWIYYQIHPDLPDWAREVIERTADGIAEQAPYSHDHTALRGMPNRPAVACCA